MLYFAFGSNMSSARLLARIGDARAAGIGQLEGWRFACNKLGSDGSAKANIVLSDGDVVWGVIYEMQDGALEALDRFEGGYRRTEVTVLSRGELVRCHTYLSETIAERLALHRWYKRHIVAGAEEHRLPEPWRAMLRALPVQPR